MQRCTFTDLLFMAGMLLSSAFELAAQKSVPVLPDPMIFVKIKEPTEGAFSLLIPKGWQSQGGLFYVDPNALTAMPIQWDPKETFW